MKLGRGLVRLAAGAALAALGCGGRQNSLLLPNLPPEVELFAQRVDPSSTGPVTYRFSWSAHDPDGRVDHFLYSVGSPALDDAHRSWEATTDRERAVNFARTAPARSTAARGEIEPRVFTLQAVDGSGARSSSARLALFDDNVAPTVVITDPPANRLIRYYVNSTTCIEWTGDDPDGIYSKRPVKYKFKILTDQTEVTLQTANSDPDSVRRYYAPRKWAGWDSTGASEPHHIYTSLTPSQEYMFVVTAFDEMGDYDPVFSRDHNMLYMRVNASGGIQLPPITVFNEYFLYSPSVGSFDPSPAMAFEAPAGRALTFNWHADPPHDSNGIPVGGATKGYRWALDIKDPGDDTPRSNEATDVERWSAWSLYSTSATLPPFNPPDFAPETHVLYIEAKQGTGCAASLPSLVAVRFNVVQPTFSHDLLIVDDTRLALDKINAGTTCDAAANRPIGNWPTQAELDTFLYARGGVPWRCYPPVGGLTQLSSPGIFNGYSFDTLGTNLRIANLTIPLSTLGQYRHVLWLVDGPGALNSKPGTDTGDLAGPQTSMRYMNAAGHASTAAAYVGQGGRLWLAGGGAATASMINFNRQINDASLPIPRTLTFRNTDNELIPGRFMYDQAHWRSEFKTFKVNNPTFRRYLGRFESAPGIYAGLPPLMQGKSTSTDPFPPNRTGQAQSVFYQTVFDIEFLSASNEIIEDLDPGPLEDFQSTLDTLYKVTASTLQPDTGPGALQSVAMTRYHGLDNEEFIVTGFSIWSFRRTQCVALVDFVLQQLWGLSPVPVGGGPRALGPANLRLPLGRQSPAARQTGGLRTTPSVRGD